MRDRGNAGSQVSDWFPANSEFTPLSQQSLMAPYGLRLRQTITSSGSVTIPDGVNWVYVIIAGAGSGSYFGYGGASGEVSWGWTLAQNTCIIGAGAAGASGGYSRYGHIIARGGQQTTSLGANYYGSPSGSFLGDGAGPTSGGNGANAGRGGGAAAGTANGGNGGNGISGGGAGQGAASTGTSTGGNGGSGLAGGGGGLGGGTTTGTRTGGNGGNGLGVDGVVYTGGAGASRTGADSGGGGGAGIAGNGSAAALGVGGNGGLGGGGGGGGGSSAGGSGILYIYY